VARLFDILPILVLASGTFNAFAEEEEPALTAMKKNDLPALQQILKARPEAVRYKSPDGLTLVHFAAMSGKVEMLAELLKAKADPKARDEKGYTPLHFVQFATRFADAKTVSKIVEMLLAYDADLNARDNNNQTPLHWVASDGGEEMARALLERGADPNLKDKDGYTPLHLAAGRFKQRVAELLLDNKADVNALSKDGLTPLHLAALKNNKLMVTLLLSHKADPNIKSPDGTTPLTATNEADIQALLRKAGAKE